MFFRNYGFSSDALYAATLLAALSVGALFALKWACHRAGQAMDRVADMVSEEEIRLGYPL